MQKIVPDVREAVARKITPARSASASPVRVPPAAGADATSQRLARIAQGAIKLAALGPRLATLAAEMNAQAQRQAADAATAAETMTRLSAELAGAVGELRGSSAAVESALATVTRIAEQTRLLSINASIEAARSGESGRAFGVVADEVQRLADNTGETTRTIEDRVHEMRASLGRVEAVGSGSGAETAGSRSLRGASEQVQDMATSAGRQLDSARNLDTCGREVNSLTESLLMTIGIFRFEAHAAAERAVASLLPDLTAAAGNRGRLESALVAWLGGHGYFELVYVTDARGRQGVANIVRNGRQITRDETGYGREWGQRPWFTAALTRDGIGSTDIYRSTATGDFCFTVSAPIRSAEGTLLGVVGADVNFQRLLLQ